MPAEQEVVKILRNMDEALRKGDVDRALACAADDMVSLPPGQDSVIGLEAQQEWSRQFFGAYSANLVHEPVDTVDCGDVVVHRGNVTGTLNPKAGGEIVSLNNKYLFIFRRYPDGELNVWRTMFNSNSF
jgi:ketosteroid isomerase-like protein